MYVAEVISDASISTYKQNIDGKKSNKLYQIRCRLISTDVTKNECVAYPADINLKRIPLVGEHVLIFRAYSDDSRYTSKKPAWYYLSNVAISTNINNNSIPGISGRDLEESQIGTTFEEQTIPAMQPYEGDVLF